MTLEDLLARTTQHLQMTLSPREYADLRNQYLLPSGKRDLPYDDEAPEFWQQIPKYLIARCPLCGGGYTERLDTYSLSDWVFGGSGDSVYIGGKQQHIECEHFVGVQSFVNLNSVVPTEESYYEGKSEVPYVMPIFLAEDPISYAVMHSLPICRVEDDAFVSRYLLFMLTYYSQNPQVLYKRRWKYQYQGVIDKPLPIMYTVGEAHAVKKGQAWDLLKWVAEGKLKWLDLNQDDLPLKSGPVEEFPYGNITGMRDVFIYRNGELHLPYAGGRKTDVSQLRDWANLVARGND